MEMDGSMNFLRGAKLGSLGTEVRQSSSGVQGKVPLVGLGDFGPQKLKQNYVFLHKFRIQ